MTFNYMRIHENTKDIVDLAHWKNSTRVGTPLEVNVKYRKGDDDLISDLMIYKKLVGSLLYLISTCPNIPYAIKKNYSLFTWYLERKLFFSTRSPLHLTTQALTMMMTKQASRILVDP